jgi:hypothetical protein
MSYCNIRRIVSIALACAITGLCAISVANAQSPTGGSQFPEAPAPGNLIVSLGLDYKTGQP